MKGNFVQLYIDYITKITQNDNATSLVEISNCLPSQHNFWHIMASKHFDWLPALTSKYEALFTSFSKWPPMKVVLMFYTFIKIKKWRKIALIQSRRI